MSLNFTVNGFTTARLDDIFFKALPVAGTVATVQDILVRAEKVVNGQLQVTEDSSQQFVPPQLETFTYDADGNMLTDGRWTYTWDAENRLIAVETLASVPVSVRRKLVFAYDGLGRRVNKTVLSWNGSAYASPQTTYYEWDGWQLNKEIRPDGVCTAFLWNTAHPRGYRVLAGMLRENGQTYYAVTDANGNVTQLYSATNAVTARYEYGPFGELLRATGPAAEQCPIRYSSEYWDAETELYYYGHRYYSPRLGRWLSKDPIEEQGGLNLYGFVGNNTPNKFDVRGLVTLSEAEAELRKRGIQEDTVYANFPMTSTYSDSLIFDEWLRLEKLYSAKNKWWEKLPRCPKKLCYSLRNAEWVYDRETWSEIGYADQAYHPKAIYEIRTRKAYGDGHGNQCTYDGAGRLITTPPAAGTADFFSPPMWNIFEKHLIPHRFHDVEPYNLADKLGRVNSYYEVRPIW